MNRTIGFTSGVALVTGAALAIGAGQPRAQERTEQPSPPTGIGGERTPGPRVPADFSEIVSRLSPSVVAVTTRAAAEEIQQGGGALSEGPYSEFFRRFFDERTPRDRPQQRRRSALGSGFVIDNAGHIVTNNHVVANASEIRVVLGDRTSLEARLVGRDSATDLAVLKLEKPPSGLRPLGWGDSEAMKPGAWTIAIGSPFGLGGTVTVGVLSARSRDIRSGPYDDFLQTDASINRGNSGGPLFNEQGEIVGVNTAIYSPTGVNIGIGFAIPSNLARDVVAELIEKGHVERGYIGATLQPVTPEIAAALGIDKPHGALVASIARGGPAERAGVKPGDVVLRFNNSEVAGVRELSRAVAATDAGQRAEVEVLRDGTRMPLTMAVERRPGEDSASTGASSGTGAGDSGRLGVMLAPLGAADRHSGLAPDETGVLIEQVMPGSAAAESGLRSGDVIVSAGAKPVDDPADVAEYWRQRQESNRSAPVLFRIRRGESYLYVAVKPS